MSDPLVKALQELNAHLRAAEQRYRLVEPPAPGTHESDLCNEGKVCCSMCALARHYITEAEFNKAEFHAAKDWSNDYNKRKPT